MNDVVKNYEGESPLVLSVQRRLLAGSDVPEHLIEAALKAIQAKGRAGFRGGDGHARRKRQGLTKRRVKRH
ncbi:MAG TPA: hypothetical protein VJQ57_09550 [Acidimicrobiia bacterium]|nr:hypothetical protein [Acidimicrobiia bacterium]